MSTGAEVMQTDLDGWKRQRCSPSGRVKSAM
nr:MAG TPA: hypothetical protein [Caudoviricetes sp.]